MVQAVDPQLPQILRKVHIENFMRLVVVDIDLEGNVVYVTGENDQGKSSLMHAITSALLGKIATPRSPVRDGQEKAVVELTFDEFVIRREFLADGTMRLTIYSTDPTITNTQQCLDRFLGQVSVDPFELANLPDKELARRLRDYAGINTDELDISRQRAYEERTLVNRDLKRVEGSLKTTPAPAGHDGEVVDVTALLDDQAALQEQLAVLNAKLREAEAANARIAQLKAQAAQRLALVKEHDTYRRQSEALTKKIEAIDAEKVALLASAKLPVEGLTLVEDGVLYQGQPMPQAGDGSRLGLTAELAFGMNPKIRILTVRQGSLMDQAARARLAKVAEKHHGQVLIEMVGTAGPVGFEIVAGQVASRPVKSGGKAPARKAS